MNKRACLMCTNFRGIPPFDWKPEHEGWKYDWADVRKLIVEKKLHQLGRCVLNPAAVEVMTNHECSHFEPLSYAVIDLNDFIWGDWSHRKIEGLKKQIENLTHQLKASRQISRSRLQRIEKLTGKAEKMAKTEEEVSE